MDSSLTHIVLAPRPSLTGPLTRNLDSVRTRHFFMYKFSCSCSHVVQLPLHLMIRVDVLKSTASRRRLGLFCVPTCPATINHCSTLVSPLHHEPAPHRSSVSSEETAFGFGGIETSTCSHGFRYYLMIRVVRLHNMGYLRGSIVSTIFLS